jgi:hypothetical protein
VAAVNWPNKQTHAATGRRRDRKAGKPRLTVRVDEWLFTHIKREAIAGKRSISEQCEMVLSKHAEERMILR